MSVLVMASNKSGGEASDLELWGVWSGFSLRLLPGSPWHTVVVSVRMKLSEIVPDYDTKQSDG